VTSAVPRFNFRSIVPPPLLIDRGRSRFQVWSEMIRPMILQASNIIDPSPTKLPNTITNFTNMEQVTSNSRQSSNFVKHLRTSQTEVKTLWIRCLPSYKSLRTHGTHFELRIQLRDLKHLRDYPRVHPSDRSDYYHMARHPSDKYTDISDQ
jgi:hypothetical protein